MIYVHVEVDLNIKNVVVNNNYYRLLNNLSTVLVDRQNVNQYNLTIF